MNKIIISPSILSADFMNLEQEIKSVENAGADWIHLDVMDGHFVPNITFGPMILENLKKYSNLHFDVHLMVNNPTKFIPWYAKAGADIITFHLEASNNPIEDINLIKQYGIKAGISIKPNTEISAILPFIDNIDLILIMSVEPGRSGQKFMPEALDKIAKAKKLTEGKDVIIEVDGGINLDNYADVVAQGADFLVMGNAFFTAKDRAKLLAKVDKRYQK